MAHVEGTARVAFQGERGAYSEASAREMFAVAAERGAAALAVDAVPCASFDDVFTALISRKVEYAAVPIENTLGGSIHANYDLLLRHHGAVHIVGEHSFRVRHALLVLKGTRKADIKRVMSHPQALAQCDGFIRRNGWECVPAYDTAGSAKMIAEQQLRDTAAICSASAAELFGLDIIESGIEDDANNFTRFLLLSRSPALPPSEAPCKTTVVFQPSTNEAGILFKALSVFALREIDLCKIESRPGRRVVANEGGRTDGAATAAEGRSNGAAAAGGAVVAGAPASKRAKTAGSGTGGSSVAVAAASFEYTFYIDLLAHTSDVKVQNALRHLGEIAPFVRVLGCFPADGILVASAADVHGGPRAQLGGGAGARAPTRSVAALRVGIVGFGNFGQFLAQWFVAAGHELFAASRTDYSEVAAKLGVTFYADAPTMIRTVARARAARCHPGPRRGLLCGEPRAMPADTAAHRPRRARRRERARRAHPRALDHFVRERARRAPVGAARGPPGRRCALGQAAAKGSYAEAPPTVGRRGLYPPHVRARVGQARLEGPALRLRCRARGRPPSLLPFPRALGGAGAAEIRAPRSASPACSDAVRHPEGSVHVLGGAAGRWARVDGRAPLRWRARCSLSPSGLAPASRCTRRSPRTGAGLQDDEPLVRGA